jgi:uncharacterized protein
MNRTRIVIFAKAPVPGQVKTRLIPALGAEGAAGLAETMLRDTWRVATLVTAADTELCVAPPAGHTHWQGRLPFGAKVSDQGEGDLGQRLERAAARVLGEGDGVVFIGTDCPELDTSRLKAACRALETHDAVIHPTFDGGYALLGLKRFDASIFRGIGWSGSDVAHETMSRIQALAWSLHLGETLRDIDEPEDLHHLPVSG